MKLKIIQSFVLLTISITICSQSLNYISPPVLDYDNERLSVYYNLNSKSSEYYSVWIEVLNSKGEKINPRTLSGDIGSNVKAGRNKKIIWNLAEDDISLDETISVKVLAQFSHLQFSKGKLIAQSAVWPGWGQSKLKKGTPYWLTGVAGVGCIGGSLLYNHKSLNTYNQYIDATATADCDKYYNQAIRQNTISDILCYSAIGIWTINIIWTALMPNKTDSGNTYRNVKLSINPLYVNNYSSSISLCLSLTIEP